MIIGATESLFIGSVSFPYTARIDSGAAKTSLHAVDLKVIGDQATNMKGDIGKTLSFTTENGAGQSQRLQAKIVGTSKISNSQGTETRYSVLLSMRFNKHTRKIKVNLRDRSDMKYKLLIGRNWLKGYYMVDVSDKKRIGALASLRITEADLTFNTRIDTGAKESSLHAFDLKIDNEHHDMMKNVGKVIHFSTANERGDTKVIQSRIIDTAVIRNAQGSELRYKVELHVGQPGQEYKVKVNLRNRTKMAHKLLIGRNWLQGHYIVDVDL